LVPFLGRYNNITKLICYTIVIVQNILLVTDQILSLSFEDINTELPFNILALFNLLMAATILMVFLMKDMPLLVNIERYNLREGRGYFG
jgi:cytochrome b subunit of formate dehydrogenase